MSVKHKLKIWYLHKIKKQDNAQILKDHLIKTGMKIGENTYIFSGGVETSEPYLVEIGDNTIIANEVHFTTHDASAKYYIDNASDIFGRIIIGSNCFIGMGSICLPGTVIPDNCIVGAGSVVSKVFCKQGMVIAGNPAHEICSIEELKRKNNKYGLNTWGKTAKEKREYLLNNQERFKGYEKTKS